MNRLGYLLLSGIVLVILLMGAAWYFLLRAPASPEPVPEVALPAPDRTYTDAGPYYEVEAVYPAHTPITDPTGSAAAIAIMDRFVKEETATWKREARLDELTPEDIEMQQLADGRLYALDIAYEVRTGAKTVSYIYTIYSDTLGAHPNAYFRTFTFDLSTGAELSLEDIFDSSTNYLDVLSETSRALLIPQIAEVSETPENELDRSMLDPGTEPKADNFQWFYFDGSLFVLIFPPYQVGPWALGTQEARIPKSELSPVLNAAYR